METKEQSTTLRRQAPGVACERQIARIAARPPEIDLDSLPEVLPGDIWQLGIHRLLCGDCTNGEDVEAVMEGALADVVATDPPYGVNYVGKRLVRKAIRNDDLGDEAFVRLLTAAFSAVPLKPGHAFYVCGPSGRNIVPFMSALEAAGLDVKQMLIWVKNHFCLSRADYHCRHEVIFYGWRPGAPHVFFGGRRQSTIFEFPKPQRSPLHPTTKPVALMLRCIENSTLPGEIVFDGFCGSGSTLIAAEQCGRLCRAIEIEPKYVAVTIARWEAAMGRTASLVSRHAKATGTSSDNEPTGKEMGGDGT